MHIAANRINDKGLMRLIFGSKVIKVEVLDEKGNILLTSEKGFTLPKDMSSEDDAIVIIKGRDLPEFERNTIVSVVTTTKSSDRIKYSGAISMSMETQMNIKLLRSGNTQLLQERRRYFKIKVNERGRALFYVRDEKTIRFDEPIEISVKDINVGGVFVICSDYEFMAGDLICFEIDLFIDAPLNASARVLRVQRDSDGAITGYGCEFQGLTASQEDCVGRFIMKVQSELRAKEADKNDF